MKDRPASEPFPVTQRERDIVERNHRDMPPPPLFCQGWHRRHAPPPKFRVRHRDDPPGKAMALCGVHARTYRLSNDRWLGDRPVWIIEELP